MAEEHKKRFGPRPGVHVGPWLMGAWVDGHSFKKLLPHLCIFEMISVSWGSI